MNISPIYWATKNKRKNNDLLPNSIRGLIVGKSGCGKTTVLLNLLLTPEYLDYSHLYVFSKSLHQPEYQIIKKGFDAGLSKQDILSIFTYNKEIEDSDIPVEDYINYIRIKKKYDLPSIKVEYYSEAEDVPHPQDMDKNNKNLCIFDDVMLTKQSAIEDYYCRGRHNNVDCFYLSQSYFKLPRQTIRENSNFFILFRQDAKNISNIHRDHASNDMTYNEFKYFCNAVWRSSNYNFVTIDLTRDVNKGKYRKNFDCFYNPNDIIGGDIHKLIGKLPRPKSGFTPSGYNYLGPYNPLSNQLKFNDKGEITEYIVPPTNAVDGIAAQHDVEYSICGNNTACKNKADRVFVDRIDNLPSKDKTKWGRFARHVINIKQKLGMGMSTWDANLLDIPLEDRSLSTSDIMQAVKELKIKNFKGVYTRDTLPSVVNDTECGVLNLDTIFGQGTHWTCWYKSGNNKFYFDSYGLDPPDEFCDYIGKEVYYNSDQIQNGGVICGHLCLYVLKKLSNIRKGITKDKYYKIIQKLF